MSADPPRDSARRGRPPGSVSLTDEMTHQIVGLIQGGVFDYVAAMHVGIAPRTFREWIERGEDRHPTRGPTPKLRRFAREVSRAKATARALAESRVFERDPRRWLTYAARTTPEEPGWTEPPAGADRDADGDTLEARLAELDRQRAEEIEVAERVVAASFPECINPKTCNEHSRRFSDEVRRIVGPDSD